MKFAIFLKSSLLFIGNPNFQGILNQILQILLYHCSKQHKNIENSHCFFSALPFVYCGLCFLYFSQRQMSSVLGHSTVWNFKRHKWSFVPLQKKKNVFLITSIYVILHLQLFHSHKKQKVSLETQGKLVVLHSCVENQTMLEPILLYQTSKCKQTKEQGSEDCLWTHIFTFL